MHRNFVREVSELPTVSHAATISALADASVAAAIPLTWNSTYKKLVNAGMRKWL